MNYSTQRPIESLASDLFCDSDCRSGGGFAGRMRAGAALFALAVMVLVPQALGQDDAAARAEAAKQRVAELQAQLEAAQADLAAAEADLSKQPPAAPEAPPEAQTPKPAWMTGWDGTVEIGINGSEGNTEQRSFRVAASAARKTEKLESTVSFSYQYATSDGETSANRFEASGRNDWLLPNSKWRYFAQLKYEYDDFQDWDQRISGFGGVGYEFISNDKNTLLGRLGIGGAYEIGGMDEGFDPEALLALDYAHVFSERQKIALSTEYYPNLSDTGEFRWINRANWQITVDPETNLFLKLGAEHRYDSDPGEGFDENDLDYFLTLGWSF